MTPPTTIVTSLDPAIERAIQRCLDPDPARRPASALAVSAALPGGDPLAAALAAGETPSPEMVAAAGEGAGLSRRVAWPVFASDRSPAWWPRLCWHCESSAFDRLRPRLTDEVLTQKANDTIAEIGYAQPRQGRCVRI